MWLRWWQRLLVKFGEAEDARFNLWQLIEPLQELFIIFEEGLYVDKVDDVRKSAAINELVNRLREEKIEGNFIPVELALLDVIVQGVHLNNKAYKPNL